MKKLLVLVVVLVLTSVASAWKVWWEVEPAKEHYEPSDVVTIKMTSDAEVLTMMVDAISSDNDGTAQEPLYLDPVLILARELGEIVNGPYGGHPYVLIKEIRGSVALGMPGVPAGETLYSFEFHVPDVPASMYITIDDYVNLDFPPPITTYFFFGDYTTADDVQPMVIHVIPEPTTIALLGLGGVLLLRRLR